MSQQSTAIHNSNNATGEDSGTPNQIASNFDSESLESEWVDEEDDDDMDFDPVENSSDQEAEFLDPSEDPEADFHGKIPASMPMSVLHTSKP